MTREQFLVRFAEVAPRYKWYLTLTGMLRSKGSVCHCPFTAVTGNGESVPFHLGRDIQRAADCRPGYDPALRAELLRLAGVTEAAS